MMTYNYECDDGHMDLDIVATSADKKKSVTCSTCGQESTPSFRAYTKGRATYNYASDAMAVHPDQIQEAMEYGSKHGVKTDYTKDGQPIIRDRGHFKQHMKAHGFHERNAFC